MFLRGLFKFLRILYASTLFYFLPYFAILIVYVDTGKVGSFVDCSGDYTTTDSESAVATYAEQAFNMVKNITLSSTSS